MNNSNVPCAGTSAFPQDNLVSACGLYCGSCGIYLATQENDAKKLLQYALVLNQMFDETLCQGCRAKRKSAHCRKMCLFIDCALKKGVKFCGSCSEYPCPELKEFQSQMPHRVEIFESQTLLRKIGIENWLLEMKEKFSCPGCNTVNSAYDVACRHCGIIPSCQFVAVHKEIIGKHFSKE